MIRKRHPRGVLFRGVQNMSAQQALRTKYTNSFQRMREPLSHLDDCQGVHYRMQLNVYRWILEKYYGQRVIGMRVVCCHPDNGDTAFVDEVPDMQNDVAEIMRRQRELCSISSSSSDDGSVFDPLGGSGEYIAEEDFFERLLEEQADMESHVVGAALQNEPFPDGSFVGSSGL